VAFLKNALEVLGDRRAVVSNDLTKKFERITRGSLSEIIPIIENAPIKGEFVICIAGFEELKAKTQLD
jgi:16S rRNA (cytidine1402-2'-O)-methyltransferase